MSHVTPRALRAGPRVPARGAQTGPPRARQTDKHSTRRMSARRGAGCVEPRLRTKALPLSVHCSCAVAPHDCTRAPVRRAAATVARLTPCDSVACAIVSIRARSPRSENRAAISSSARHRQCICDQACCPLTLSVEMPLVGKASAALPRDGREFRPRDGRPRAWSQMSVDRRRCHGEDAQLSCASGSSGQRGTTARCLMWPGRLNDVRCWARAQRRGGVQRAALALCVESVFFCDDVCRRSAGTERLRKFTSPRVQSSMSSMKDALFFSKGLGHNERSFAGYDPRINYQCEE